MNILKHNQIMAPPNRIHINLKKACKFIMLALIWLLAGPLQRAAISHPHVFVDYSYAAVFNENGLNGIEARWRFDEMFSSEIIRSFDRDGNGDFDDSELNSLRYEAFKELPEVEYFILMRVDGKAKSVKKIIKFRAYINDGRLAIRFVIPILIQAGARFRSIEVTTLDEEFFIDFQLDRSYPMAFLGPSGFMNRVSLTKEPKLAYYFDQIIPEILRLEFRKDK